MERVRIGLAGCGSIAQGMHLPGIAQMREMGKAALVAVADVLPERAQAVATRFGAPAAYGTLEALLGRDDVDLVVNTTPIPEHFAVSLAALEAGKHVYTQKPMATSVDEATALLDAAARRGRLLACAPEHPVRPVIQTIRRLAEEGAIGVPTFARVQASHDGPEKHNVPRDSTWYYKPGSDPILDLGVHGLSQITSILGPVRRLACLSGRTQPERTITAGPYAGTRIEVEIDDASLLLLDFGRATFAFLDATYCVEASRGPRLELHGSAGTLSLVSPPAGSGAGAGPLLQLFETSRGGWREVDVPPAPPCRDLGVLHAVDCLREGTPLTLTAEQGRHLVEVMTRAPEAARAGRTLDLRTTF
ncbi:MAG TPA: Gfo/Idh/MocA family oxidoreductase [Chloroflexota bacterium]|nr:Gfo/Idh/MocA family oxidoreductase [Chloroflexota bacterium]